MKALVPTEGLSTLRKEMDRLFERFWDLEPTFLPASIGEFIPPLDLGETKDELIARIEVPGIEPKEIEVSLQDQVLIVKGEKRQEKGEREEHLYRSERSVGTFVRTLRLPAPVDAGKVTAVFKNGLLTITLPKIPSARTATIPIQEE